MVSSLSYFKFTLKIKISIRNFFISIHSSFKFYLCFEEENQVVLKKLEIFFANIQMYLLKLQ